MYICIALGIGITYASICLSGCMACPSPVVLKALHYLLIDLYHQLHNPIIYLPYHLSTKKGLVFYWGSSKAKFSKALSTNSSTTMMTNMPIISKTTNQHLPCSTSSTRLPSTGAQTSSLSCLCTPVALRSSPSTKAPYAQRTSSINL